MDEASSLNFERHGTFGRNVLHFEMHFALNDPGEFIAALIVQLRDPFHQ